MSIKLEGAHSQPEPATPLVPPASPPHPPPGLRRPRWQLIVVGLVTLLVAAVLGASLWYALELRPANSHAKQPISFEVRPGTSVSQLANQLAAARVIRSADAFTLYVTIHGLRRDLQAGSYDLYPSDSTETIANVLSHGKIAHNTLVVPEGSTVTKIRTLAAAKGISTASFNAALGDDYPNAFLTGRPAGDSSLEGYLFPNSYEVNRQTTAHALIAEMLNNFGEQANQAGLSSAFAAQGLTFHQGVTLASIVEREAGTAADRPIIAQVFLKRLRQGMPLQSDVTVDYASLLTGQPFSVRLDSPYNTYLHVGLPPGPIANPGLSSLQAVAHPATTDYLYFLADKNGVVHYAQTAEQHQANVQKYLSQ